MADYGADFFLAPHGKNDPEGELEATIRGFYAPPGADEPRWSPDGKKILYRQATRWYEVPAPGVGLKPAGPPRVLFQGIYSQAWESWELGPDGRLLLLQGEAPIRLTRLNVITSFPRFLAEKLGKR